VDKNNRGKMEITISQKGLKRLDEIEVVHRKHRKILNNKIMIKGAELF